ncbi:Low-density lipoprotein receptor-related protein 4 [Hypsibius exemplaris]|uniref:Low-density lipoprotein receptor-related protein 4 n=1 Tax=Hypsibius exemplaris TaxID=2072580 RepID=A0A1W0WEQ5_HYPEX|nr:Low-density lipoprotein receptor-related protein 4 [Hypsibius exemplaris]
MNMTDTNNFQSRRLVSLAFIITCYAPCLTEADWLSGPGGSYWRSVPEVYGTTTAAPACQPGFFRCNSGKCIYNNWVCDGASDCPSGEDERPFGLSCQKSYFDTKRGTTMPTRTTTTSAPVIQSCATGWFRCDSGNRDCVHSRYVCDGDRDCTDGSDELSCSGVTRGPPPNTTTCQYGEIFCMLQNMTNGCVPLAKLCDNQTDCQDGSDEGVHCRTACSLNNGNCSDTCHPTPGGPFCSCPLGLTRDANERTCTDIDECLSINATTTHPCSQACNNTRGSFTCMCAEGFLLDADGVSCEPDGNPLLIYASAGRLHWVTPKGSLHDLVVEGARSFVTVGIDFLAEENSTTIFYADSKRNEILQVDVEAKTEQVVLGGLRCPDGLALDWVSLNLYYVDSENEVLGVCALRDQTAYCTKILSDRLESPRAVAVHPAERVIFFTQWGWEAKIERAWLDGSNRVDLVTTKLSWPNALAIDYIQNRLYWIDAKLDRIESVKFDGLDRRTSLHLPGSHPYGLTILGERLYWSEWASSSIRSAPLNGSSNSTVHLTDRRPLGIVAMHPSRQPPASSPCDTTRPNPCHHICLALWGANLHHICLCHAGFRLSGGVCMPLGTTPGEPPRVLVHGREGHLNATTVCRTSRDCNCTLDEAETPEEVCVCLQSRCTTPQPTRRRTISPPTEESKQFVSAAGLMVTNTALAFIICGAILCVLVLILLAVILARKHRRGSTSHSTDLLNEDSASQCTHSSGVGDFFAKINYRKAQKATPTFAVNFHQDKTSDDGVPTVSGNF